MKRRTCDFAVMPVSGHRPTIASHTQPHNLYRLIATMSAFVVLAGCASCKWNLDRVHYAPVAGQDWQVSTPAAQGLDPNLVAKLYYKAAKVKTVQAVLVVKNGYLIAERYYHGGAIDNASRVQSVTKSVTSALVGLALEQGHLTSLDQKMVKFFPELAGQVTDSRKYEVTIRHMLQMRAGYPWEESTAELFKMLYGGFRPSLLEAVPLSTYPGTRFEYSNLTAHLLGVIVARAMGMDLKSYAKRYVFDPIGVEISDWITDWEGNYNGHADLFLNARDMAKFGLLYLNNGVYDGKQIIPARWVEDSLETYSHNAWKYRVGRNFRDMGYGYLWWSARAGNHRFNFAWGHGGQQIALLKEYNMVVVVKADPLFGQHGGAPWRREKENLNLVGNFIATLPEG